MLEIETQGLIVRDIKIDIKIWRDRKIYIYVYRYIEKIIEGTILKKELDIDKGSMYINFNYLNSVKSFIKLSLPL